MKGHIPLYKKFNGKRYRGAQTYSSKRDAQALAKLMRKKGHHARVTYTAGRWVTWID